MARMIFTKKIKSMVSGKAIYPSLKIGKNKIEIND